MAKHPPHEAKNSASGTDSPGHRLSRALAHLGINQAEVSRRARAPASYVNDVIHGRRRLTEGFAGAIQYEFGVDRIWLLFGEGEMFRRLPPQPGLEGAGHMMPLPLLDEPCTGNPLDSGAWAGSTHPVPRGQARPTSRDRYRYVLRVKGQGARGDVRDGDLVIVENVPKEPSPDLRECWCIVATGDDVQLLRLRKTERPSDDIWGWCAGIVWRPFPTPI